jgi:hypothetical protein
VQQTFADAPYRFMIDAEGALRLGRQLDEGMVVWLEAPSDYRLVA